MTVCGVVRCARPAAVRLYGKYRNGREVMDERCAEHAPADLYGRPLCGPQPSRPLAFYGATARMFQIDDIERIKP